MIFQTSRSQRGHLLRIFAVVFLTVATMGCGGGDDDVIVEPLPPIVDSGPAITISAPGVVNNAVTLNPSDTLQFSSTVVVPQSVNALSPASTGGESTGGYRSSNPAVASITTGGLLTARTEGQTTISAANSFGRAANNTVVVNVVPAGSTNNSRLTGSYITGGAVINDGISFVLLGDSSFDGVGTMSALSGLVFSDEDAGVQIADTSSAPYSVSSTGVLTTPGGADTSGVTAQLSADNSQAAGTARGGGGNGQFVMEVDNVSNPTVASLAQTFTLVTSLTETATASLAGSITLGGSGSAGSISGTLQAPGGNPGNFTGTYTVNASQQLVGTFTVRDTVTAETATAEFVGIVGGQPNNEVVFLAAQYPTESLRLNFLVLR